jgi:predicted outer membrane protein
MSLVVGVVLLLAAAAGSAKDKADGARVAVHLTSGAGLPDDDAARKAAEKELAAKAEAVCKAWGETEASLRAKYGKKPESWPAEAQAERARAALPCDVASFDRFYRHSSQKEIDDARSELRENLEDNDATALVAAPEEAILLVKVVGRSRISFKGSAAPYSCVGLEVSPGGKANVAPFGDLGEGVQPSSYFGVGSRQVATFHPYTPTEPYWLVDGCGQGLRWKMAANGGEIVLKRLAKNYATRTATAGSHPE